jgi:5-(carboxyamino)imidazole ribonucleotide synthase
MRVGVLGAGQLGRMLALAGYPLGMRFRFLAADADAPAGQLAEQVVGTFDDERDLDRFAAGLDVATYEFENVPLPAARYVARRVPAFLPTPDALYRSQDRLVEKTFFRDLGIPTPAFAPVDGRADLDAALRRLGLPAVLKTRRLGYDGKGQLVLREPADVERAWGALGGAPLLLEEYMTFDRELSLLAVQGRDGSRRFYPLVENEHRGGILCATVAPAPAVDPALQHRAEETAGRLLAALAYVGVLALELFQRGGMLLANEMAPRVHNSGHWTTEGAETSQFENHLRAVAGWPLGGTRAVGHTVMHNLIGAVPDPARILEVPGAHLHLYGKAGRPGRKLGHVTVCAPDAAMLADRRARVESALAP